MIEDMAVSMSVFGRIDEAANGWRGKVVKLAGTTEVQVSEPRIPLVEMDGMEVFDMLVQIGRGGARAVVAEIGIGEALKWAKTKIPEETYDYDSKTVVVAAVMFEVMRAQGWRHVSIQWRSPAWLFPEYVVPYGAIIEVAKASFVNEPSLETS